MGLTGVLWARTHYADQRQNDFEIRPEGLAVARFVLASSAGYRDFQKSGAAPYCVHSKLGADALYMIESPVFTIQLCSVPLHAAKRIRNAIAPAKDFTHCVFGKPRLIRAHAKD